MLRKLCALHILFFIYSLSGVMLKEAALNNSNVFVIIAICILGIYAIGWQNILSKIELSVAMANRVIVIIWGITWGKMLFNETISQYIYIGALLIFFGIYLVNKNDV